MRTIILATNINNVNILNQYLSTLNYEEINILQRLYDMDNTIANTLPFLSYIDGLCVEIYNNHRTTYSLNLGKCRKIKSFQLKDNDIKEVPRYIKSFKCIYDISFYRNKLTSSCFTTITRLYTLRSLNLGKNLIEKIPQNILKLVNIKELTLPVGKFIDIPCFITHLKLKKLSLTDLNPVINKYNGIKRNEDIGCKIINDFLKIKTIECLILTSNKMSYLNFHNKAYGIKILNLSRNNITTLSDSVIKFKNLEYLDLSKNKLKTVPSILGKLESLKELNLKNNPIISCKDIYFYSLRTLILSPDIRCEEFSITFKSSPLEHLSIYGGPHSPKMFSEIYHMVSIKSLSLHGQFPTFRITEELEIFPNLESLYIDSVQVECIKDSILEIKSLKTLNLKLNIEEVGGFPESLFSNLKKLKKLESLSLKDIKKKSILYDKIFDLENLKRLELFGFYIENVKKFNNLTSLKYLFIENTDFNGSQKEVNSYLQKPNRIVKYHRCSYMIVNP